MHFKYVDIVILRVYLQPDNTQVLCETTPYHPLTMMMDPDLT
jgi:hypothetical protein